MYLNFALIEILSGNLPGYYCDVPGLAVQKNCDAGYYCGAAANKKESCPPGTYRNELNGKIVAFKQGVQCSIFCTCYIW